MDSLRCSWGYKALLIHLQNIIKTIIQLIDIPNAICESSICILNRVVPKCVWCSRCHSKEHPQYMVIQTELNHSACIVIGWCIIGKMPSTLKYRIGYLKEDTKNTYALKSTGEKKGEMDVPATEGNIQ